MRNGHECLCIEHPLNSHHHHHHHHHSTHSHTMGHQRDFTETSAARQGEVMDWIETVTGTKFDKKNMHESLKNGIILCELANKVSPGIIKGVKNSKIKFMQMENVTLFIQALRKLGVSEHDNFSTIDLYEGKDLNQVLNAIEAFSRVSRKIDTFKGPYIGAKESERQTQAKTPKKGGNYVGGLMEQKQINIDKKLGPTVHKATLTGNDFSHTHTAAKTSSPKVNRNVSNTVGLLEKKVQNIKIDHDKVHPSLAKNDWSHTHTKEAPRPPVKNTPPTAPVKSQPAPAGGSNQGDAYAEIEKLHGLKEKGIITEQEFALKKKQLLGL
mmetsp:Transcript_7732/g.28988  ORF Transcript_7732/g.28988 Transcript_7732/m.28988 type:complete len:325 (-) Transcript_7732:112-1086(-)